MNTWLVQRLLSAADKLSMHALYGHMSYRSGIKINAFRDINALDVTISFLADVMRLVTEQVAEKYVVKSTTALTAH